MRVNRTYSIAHSTIESLNAAVRPNLRSKFVDRAIQDRLRPDEFDHELLGTRRLMLILLSRDLSEPTKRAIALELGIDVSGYL